MLSELQSRDNNVTKVGEVQSRTLRPEKGRRGRVPGKGFESPSLLSKYKCRDSRHLLAAQITPIYEFVDVGSGARQPLR